MISTNIKIQYNITVGGGHGRPGGYEAGHILLTGGQLTLTHGEHTCVAAILEDAVIAINAAESGSPLTAYPVTLHRPVAHRQLGLGDVLNTEHLGIWAITPDGFAQIDRSSAAANQVR